MNCDDKSLCTKDYCSSGVCHNDPITCDDKGNFSIFPPKIYWKLKIIKKNN